MPSLPIIQFEQIKTIASSYIKPVDLTIIEQAYLVAEKAHLAQQRKSGEPYIQHPLYVALTLANLKLDSATLAAAFLHDVIEDTPNTLNDIRHRFGRRIASLVNAVTKLDEIEESSSNFWTTFFVRNQAKKPLSQQERRLESLRKMLLASSQDVRVILIKLADRLHNMQTLGCLERERQIQIAEETLQIYAPIAYRLGMGNIKGQLEDFSFCYLQPSEYKALQVSLNKAASNREDQIEKARRVLLKVLKKAGIEAEIHSRVKHLYSLYRKLERYNHDLSRIYDLVACRIIVDTVEQCYQVLGLIHQRWKPVEGRVKDYIAAPKPNGYQSLHTTVKAVENRPIEIQIRTKTMHEQAELGVAAHWQYSERKGTLDYIRRKVTRVNKNELLWVNELAKWQKAIQSYEDLDNLMKIDFFGNRIFAYTPKGEVIDLPKGATSIDFAYAIHSEIGNHLAGSKVNGKMVRLQDELRSGDTVELIVQKKASPKPDWLNETKTNHAKSHIRQALRKQ